MNMIHGLRLTISSEYMISQFQLEVILQKLMSAQFKKYMSMQMSLLFSLIQFQLIVDLLLVIATFLALQFQVALCANLVDLVLLKAFTLMKL